MDKGGRAPSVLIEICERAMDREPSCRFDNALQMAKAIADWLDGSKKMEQAQEVVQTAQALQSQRAELIDRVTHHRSEAKLIWTLSRNGLVKRLKRKAGCRGEGQSARS